MRCSSYKANRRTTLLINAYSRKLNLSSVEVSLFSRTIKARMCGNESEFNYNVKYDLKRQLAAGIIATLKVRLLKVHNYRS